MFLSYFLAGSCHSLLTEDPRHILGEKTISRSLASLLLPSHHVFLNCLNTQQKVTRGHTQTVCYQGTAAWQVDNSQVSPLSDEEAVPNPTWNPLESEGYLDK